MDRASRTNPNGSTPEKSAADTEREREQKRADERHRAPANPPRTTSGGITAPKFGSATSGGGELEPGPERD